MLGSILILRQFNLLIKRDRSQRKCPVGSRGAECHGSVPDSGRGKGNAVGELALDSEVLPFPSPPGEEIFIPKFIFSEGTKEEITERRSEDCFFNFEGNSVIFSTRCS